MRASSISAGWQAACRSRSSASRTWIFDLLMPALRDSREQRLPVVRAQLVVELALRPFELAVDGLLACSGRSGATCSLVRRRMNGRSARARIASVLGLGLRPSDRRRLERRRRPEHARVEELEQAPQLAEVVLDRRAAQRQAVLALQQAGRLGRGRCGVLDRLRLVEDHVVELDVLQDARCRAAACRRS